MSISKENKFTCSLCEKERDLISFSKGYICNDCAFLIKSKYYANEFLNEDDSMNYVTSDENIIGK